MRVPSRQLPPRQEPAAGWLLCLLLVGGYVALLIAYPMAVLLMTLFIALLGLAGHHRDARIAAARTGESICTFARGFGREIDTWIVRALYEELCEFGPIPPRASDDLATVFGIDDDLEDLIEDVATRAAYSLEYAATYWLARRLRTVEDLAVLVNDQPCPRLAVAS